MISEAGPPHDGGLTAADGLPICIERHGGNRRCSAQCQGAHRHRAATGRADDGRRDHRRHVGRRATIVRPSAVRSASAPLQPFQTDCSARSASVQLLKAAARNRQNLPADPAGRVGRLSCCSYARLEPMLRMVRNNRLTTWI